MFARILCSCFILLQAILLRLFYNKCYLVSVVLFTFVLFTIILLSVLLLLQDRKLFTVHLSLSYSKVSCLLVLYLVSLTLIRSVPSLSRIIYMFNSISSICHWFRVCFFSVLVSNWISLCVLICLSVYLYQCVCFYFCLFVCFPIHIPLSPSPI